MDNNQEDNYKNAMNAMMKKAYDLLTSDLVHPLAKQHKKDEFESMFLYACVDGDLELMQFMIHQDIKYGGIIDYPNIKDASGNSPLRIPCIKGNGNVVKLLLKHGAKVSETDHPHQKTPLHHACQHGYLEIAKLLIRYGAALEPMDVEGLTPFCHACMEGHLEIANLLLEVAKLLYENGSKGIVQVEDCYGKTPLHRACFLGENMLKIGMLLIKNGALVNAKCADGDTPLHEACKNSFDGGLELVKLLIEHGADPNAKNNDGFTPLFYASNEDPAMAEFLVQNGAKADANNS